MTIQRDRVLCRLNLYKTLSKKGYSNSTETLIINRLKNNGEGPGGLSDETGSDPDNGGYSNDSRPQSILGSTMG